MRSVPDGAWTASGLARTAKRALAWQCGASCREHSQRTLAELRKNSSQQVGKPTASRGEGSYELAKIRAVAIQANAIPRCIGAFDEARRRASFTRDATLLRCSYQRVIIVRHLFGLRTSNDARIAATAMPFDVVSLRGQLLPLRIGIAQLAYGLHPRVPMPQTTPQQSPRMFKSDFFERFSRAHPLTPAVLYLPLACVALIHALQQQALARVTMQLMGGYLLWTLAEYWLHRLLFHLPVVGPKTQRIAFLLHGVHHEAPWDETRLVMPAGASIALCALSYATFHAIFGPFSMWAPFAGFIIGYVGYDEIHWYLHAGKPRSRLGRWLRREHFLHHFAETSTRFGVSCPWLDWVFFSRSKS